jgi:membrane-associated phospholipid phosphatase
MSTSTRRLVDVLVPVLLLVALVALTVGVVQGGITARIDDLVYGATPGQGNGPVVPGFLALLVIDIATPAVSIGAVLLLAVILWVRTGRSAPFVLAGPAMALLTVTVLLGKALIDRPGPGYDEVFGIGGGAYPSGHAATALVCAGVVAALISQARPGLRRAAWVAAGTWTLLVTAALLWLHFHWLSDVVGSMLLGSLLMWLLLRWPLRLGVRIGSSWRHGGHRRAR